MFGQGKVVTLPSGLKVRGRRPSLITLVAADIFPDELTTQVVRMYNKDVVSPEDIIKASEEGKYDFAALRHMFIMMEKFLPNVLVAPTIGETTAVEVDGEGVCRGTVQLIDIDDIDKQYLFLWGQGLLRDNALELDGEKKDVATGEVKAADLTSFRDGEQSAEAGSAGAAVQSAPVESVGTSA